MAKKRGNGRTDGKALVRRRFGKSFCENLAALMDDQIADMMKDPEFRKIVRDFNVRMFEVMANVARKHLKAGRA